MCDFVKAAVGARTPKMVPWTKEALPSVVVVTSVPSPGAVAPLTLDVLQRERLLEDASVIFTKDTPIRIERMDTEGAPAVLIPLDALFEMRAAARLWRALRGLEPGPDPQHLPLARRRRLVRALCALDGRLAKASYREIAKVLFGPDRIAGGGWKTHSLRDQTIRLTKLGADMMDGGYRRLLQYPHRSRF